MLLKIILILSVSISASLSLATTSENQILDETVILEPAPKTKEQILIENLLGGLDLKINELLTNQDSEQLQAQYKIVFSLVVKNEADEKTVIEIFSTDEFSNTSTAHVINKEFYIPSKAIFKALEPHLDLIEKSEKLKLEVSLNKIEEIAPGSSKQVLQKQDFEVYFRTAI